MKRRTMLSLLVLLSLLMGCAMKQASAPAATMEPIMEAPADYDEERSYSSATGGAVSGDDPSAPVGETMPRMIIYDGELNLVVQDTEETQENIVAMAGDLGGYISNSSSYAYGEGLMRITLVVRVPAENFNAAMALLRAMAIEIERESIGSQDVTQEYVDLESRLRALEAKATRLEELMEEAEDTEAVLAVYEQLSATQQEIEQTKGRMRYLERMSAMATITVQLTPDELSQPVEIAGWRPGGTLKRALEALITAFQFLVDALIWIVVWGVPVLGVIILAFFGFIRLLRWIFKPRKAKDEAPDAEELPPHK